MNLHITNNNQDTTPQKKPFNISTDELMITFSKSSSEWSFVVFTGVN